MGCQPTEPVCLVFPSVLQSFPVVLQTVPGSQWLTHVSAIRTSRESWTAQGLQRRNPPQSSSVSALNVLHSKGPGRIQIMIPGCACSSISLVSSSRFEPIPPGCSRLRTKSSFWQTLLPLSYRMPNIGREIYSLCYLQCICLNPNQIDLPLLILEEPFLFCLQYMTIQFCITRLRVR